MTESKDSPDRYVNVAAGEAGNAPDDVAGGVLPAAFAELANMLCTGFMLLNESADSSILMIEG